MFKITFLDAKLEQLILDIVQLKTGGLRGLREPAWPGLQEGRQEGLRVQPDGRRRKRTGQGMGAS